MGVTRRSSIRNTYKVGILCVIRTMTDETKEGAGGWEVPKRADNDELVSVFRDKHVTFRSHSAGFDVYLDGNENVDVVDAAVRRGYEVKRVTTLDGEFDTKITFGTKINVRTVNDSKENSHRVGEDD
ncbi:hypothetical protein OSG_eHP10_00180 [environmental Halophage eHP-10]|nr:hypothetical protein OSG_eHP10_00180 [environmental Halophage eHP-10]